ncbi:MAG: hypothetical protein HY813_03370 [Candidatus Portnoybacteria bacterium]|nr:hypothetical protein [Candidatus Portnoybacteria bacterium]
MEIKYLCWVGIAMQVLAFLWFSCKGGVLSDKEFYLFTLCMFAGQAGIAGEGYMSSSINWGAVIGQGIFFIITAIGGIQRFRLARKRLENNVAA